MFEFFNGAKYSQKIRKFLKNDETLRPPGMPDIFGGAHGQPFAIEMKRPKMLGRRKGTIKPEQSDMHQKLISVGYVVSVCYTLQDAINFVNAIKDLTP